MIINIDSTPTVDFREIEQGGCFYIPGTQNYFMKIEGALRDDDDDNVNEEDLYCNAVFLNDGSLTGFYDTSKVIPVTLEATRIL